MARKIDQIRYYADSSPMNQPLDLLRVQLTNGSIFNGKLPITQLGIQALPGTKFYLNNSTFPIVVGPTGIYELNLEGISEITSIYFSSDSLKAIASTSSSFLIIDFIYEN